MQIAVVQDAEAAGAIVAADIQRLVAKDPRTILGVATGSTPLPVYAHLRALHQAGKLDLAHVHAFALDEYVGIAKDHPQRYRNVLIEELVGGTGLSEKHLHTPDGSAKKPKSAARAYDEEIRMAGGISYQILGIGADGHIAFNEPGGSLRSRTHTTTLTEQTRRDNARFFDNDINQVPELALTQGLGTILEAKRISLLAFGENKAEAVKQLVEGPISARWPATILQEHNRVTVLLDEAAASKLELRDYYAQMWEKERAGNYR